MRKLPAAVTAALVVAGLPAAPAISATGTPPPAVESSAAPPTAEFQKVTLNASPGEPIDLAVLPDGRVLHTTRDGRVWLHDPARRLNTLAAELDVYTHDEEGLQSIAVDPGFDGRDNRWVYLFHAPPLDTPVDDPSTPGVNEGAAPDVGTDEDWERFTGVTRLSRFELVGNTLDLSTEQHILDVEADRGICCHVGGDIVFDNDGNLYLSTGDDTNPHASGGYAPIDARPERNPSYDAQRTSANTDDLRGKVLRITVGEDGSYTIPEGNLFAPGTEGARPEIYLMGLRNPFRMEIDPVTDDLYVADYSPDARTPSPTRGPNGHGKWFVARAAGNHGWPHCVTPAMPYHDRDFATGADRGAFDCSAPVNTSPRNTGLTELPPVEQPDVWYPNEVSPIFPGLGSGGIGPMAGPAYAFDPVTTRGRAPIAWPEHYDGVPLFYEFTRNYLKGFHPAADGVSGGTGGLAGIEDVVPGMSFSAPIDMEFGPDGALYVLEYGRGYFQENPDAELSRIDYIGPGGNHTPIPAVSADVTRGEEPLTVSFSSAGTVDPDGDRLRYEWDFDSDGRIDSRAVSPAHTYTEPGVHTATLKVTDIGGRHRGKSASAEIDITVGANEAPVVTFVRPTPDLDFAFGDTVGYEVGVSDDQPVDCSRVTVTYILGHDDHGHPMSTASGCTGSFVTTVPEGHDVEEDNLRAVFVASYTDPGLNGLPPLTGSAEVVLLPTG
ncbi:PQQ-dependent sugar dehydrogenase [Streptomyces sp. ST2-7A]|uniref:PQQ-dependent sugar dehydrogenase n=1 Tax=Streptomyces sp. ST2-7A TaxID=2907214 RepID=UPI001F263124|nr:PQQ-dependent sugar dehydrogenase [Streptomyces sp. ST2-7A]MCE7079450.1 PQQ-dependent sugar dehydrogenase [Streptomyces sp. ST2-7A]